MIEAHQTLNPAHVDVQQEIVEITGGKGVDLAIEAVGITPAVNQALDSLKMAGNAFLSAIRRR